MDLAVLLIIVDQDELGLPIYEILVDARDIEEYYLRQYMRDWRNW